MKLLKVVFNLYKMITNKKPAALFISVLLLFINVSTASNSSTSTLKCKFCKKSIKSRYITIGRKAYHENCYRDHVQLRCDHCKNLIDGTYNFSNEKNYHEKCYKDFILELNFQYWKNYLLLFLKTHCRFLLAFLFQF